MSALIKYYLKHFRLKMIFALACGVALLMAGVNEEFVNDGIDRAFPIMVIVFGLITIALSVSLKNEDVIFALPYSKANIFTARLVSLAIIYLAVAPVLFIEFYIGYGDYYFSHTFLNNISLILALLATNMILWGLPIMRNRILRLPAGIVYTLLSLIIAVNVIYFNYDCYTGSWWAKQVALPYIIAIEIILVVVLVGRRMLRRFELEATCGISTKRWRMRGVIQKLFGSVLNLLNHTSVYFRYMVKSSLMHIGLIGLFLSMNMLVDIPYIMGSGLVLGSTPLVCALIGMFLLAHGVPRNKAILLALPIKRQTVITRLVLPTILVLVTYFTIIAWVAPHWAVDTHYVPQIYNGIFLSNTGLIPQSTWDSMAHIDVNARWHYYIATQFSCEINKFYGVSISAEEIVKQACTVDSWGVEVQYVRLLIIGAVRKMFFLWAGLSMTVLLFGLWIRTTAAKDYGTLHATRSRQRIVLIGVFFGATYLIVNLIPRLVLDGDSDYFYSPLINREMLVNYFWPIFMSMVLLCLFFWRRASANFKYIELSSRAS